MEAAFDAGFARKEIMAWGEEHGAEHIAGPAKKSRLMRKVAREIHGPPAPPLYSFTARNASKVMKSAWWAIQPSTVRAPRSPSLE